MGMANIKARPTGLGKGIHGTAAAVALALAHSPAMAQTNEASIDTQAIEEIVVTGSRLLRRRQRNRRRRAVTVRRLHDTSRTGWWLLLVFLPLIGAIVLLVFMFLDSTSGTNEYGPDPKGAQD